MKTQTKEITHRLVALLNREEIEFINRLSVDAFFSTGHRLTKVDIVAALVDAAIQLGVSGLNVKSRQYLVKKIISAAIDYSERRKYPRLKNLLPSIAGLLNH
jgi:hypothetical protein